MTPKRPFVPLTTTARAASLDACLAAAPRGEPIRVFAYASLMWRPEFGFSQRIPARLPGYRRSMCVWTVKARGTPDCPGLGLGLECDPSTSCAGVVFELASDCLRADLERLWEREMMTGIYRPVWVQTTASGGALAAIAFAVEDNHPQYAGRLPPARQAALIAHSAGTFGTCRDYLANTLKELESLDILEPALRDVLRQVDGCDKSWR